MSELDDSGGSSRRIWRGPNRMGFATGFVHARPRRVALGAGTSQVLRSKDLGLSALLVEVEVLDPELSVNRK